MTLVFLAVLAIAAGGVWNACRAWRRHGRGGG